MGTCSRTRSSRKSAALISTQSFNDCDPFHRLKMSFCSFSRGEKYRDHFDAGLYVCSKCHYPRFASTSKFKHATPWPAFQSPVRDDSLSKRQESSHAYKVSRGKCGNGLGHEFLGEGPKGK